MCLLCPRHILGIRNRVLNTVVTNHTLIFRKIVKKGYLTFKFKQERGTEIMHKKQISIQYTLLAFRR